MPVNEHALEIAARLITAKAGPEEVLDAVLNAALDSTKATRGLVALVDRRNGELAIRKVAGEGWTTEKREKRLRAGAGVHEGITGYVNHDCYLAHFDPDGIPQSILTLSSDRQEWASDVASMPGGGAVLVGTFRDTASVFIGSSLQAELTSTGDLDGFMVAVNPDDTLR